MTCSSGFRTDSEIAQGAMELSQLGGSAAKITAGQHVVVRPLVEFSTHKSEWSEHSPQSPWQQTVISVLTRPFEQCGSSSTFPFMWSSVAFGLSETPRDK
jgi:hypothetical protein